MGASLLAKAVCQPTYTSADIKLSRAGSLPQVYMNPHNRSVALNLGGVSVSNLPIPRPTIQTAVSRLSPLGPSIHLHALEWLSALG
ncbi:hypothetical protein DM828_28230 [Pseudomonas umsongensis]|nr:hypothetical protein [Pseudomonas umsongensis]